MQMSMRRTFTPAGLALSLALSIGAASAQTGFVATTLGFEELPDAAVGARVPDGYGGFDWGTTFPTFYMTQAASAGSAENNFVAFSSSSSRTFFRSARADFYLDGVDFFSRRGLDAVGDAYFVLYNNGVTVYNGLDDKSGRNVFNNTSTTFRPMVFHETTKTSSPYAGPIDGFAITFDNDDHDHLAMDNLQLRVISSVPEPARYALLLAGLAMAGTVARRRTTATRA